MEVIKAGKGRPSSADGQLCEAVGAIVEDVRRHGDEALIRYGRKFDGSPRERMYVRIPALSSSDRSRPSGLETKESPTTGDQGTFEVTRN